MLRLEIESARREVGGKVRSLGIGSAIIAVASVLVVLAIVTLLVSAVDALSIWLAPWLAALVVSFALLLCAAGLILAGVRLLKRSVPPLPTDTLHHMKEDFEWAKTRVNSGKP